MTEADSVHSTPRINSPIGRLAESVDSFSAQPAPRLPEAGERASNSPRAIPGPSNVFAFPGGGRPTSNSRELNDPSFEAHRRWRSPGYTPSGRPNMHTFVFRSYDLIVRSTVGALVRDVACDLSKAKTKLKRIQDQLLRDREHAAARAELLTKAEARLSAAIGSVRSNRSVEG